jgi:hypothetical protein
VAQGQPGEDGVLMNSIQLSHQVVQPLWPSKSNGVNQSEREWAGSLVAIEHAQWRGFTETATVQRLFYGWVSSVFP